MFALGADARARASSVPARSVRPPASRAATADNEQELLELALHATAAQLERIVRAYRGAAAGVDAANAAHRERYLSWAWDDDGCLSIRGRLPAEDGALLLRALQAARERLPREGAGHLRG